MIYWSPFWNKVKSILTLEQLHNTRPYCILEAASFEERGRSIHMQISGRVFWSLSPNFQDYFFKVRVPLWWKKLFPLSVRWLQHGGWSVGWKPRRARGQSCIRVFKHLNPKQQILWKQRMRLWYTQISWEESKYSFVCVILFLYLSKGGNRLMPIFCTCVFEI